MDPHLPPLRDYSEAELLALPPDSRLLFADNVHDGLVTYDNVPKPARRRRILQPRHALSPSQLQSTLSRVRALRCLSHGLSAFSLYPTTDQQYRVNHFLWRAANSFSFQAREATHLFQRNVFVVCMPAPLFDFLTSVTWQQLETTILVILTILAQGNRGIAILQTELAPCLVAKLHEFAGMSDPLSRADPHAFRLMLDLVMDRIVCMGPWVIPTSLCYLSASDMTDLLAHRYERSIFSTPEKFELVHTMMWNIYRDWQTYRHVLVRNGGRPRLEALELMALTISKGTQSMMHQAIRTLNQITVESARGYDTATCHRKGRAPRPRRRPTYLSWLPTDVIVGKLMPDLCEAYASDEKLKRRVTGSAAVTDATAEVVSPVTVPFSLKSWVLEDHLMHQFYHSLDSEDTEEVEDTEMRDSGEGNTTGEAETHTEEHGNNEGGSSETTDGVETEAAEGATRSVAHEGGRAQTTEEEHVEEDGEAEGDCGNNFQGETLLSPRTLRRRLNEQGSFETVSGETGLLTASGLSPPSASSSSSSSSCLPDPDSGSASSSSLDSGSASGSYSTNSSSATSARHLQSVFILFASLMTLGL